MSLEGKRVVLTGGTRGIGTFVAKELTAQGADVLVVGRRPPELVAGRFLQGDLSTATGVTHIAAALVAESPDILINMAGTQFFGPFEQESSEHVQTSFMVNLLAPVLLTQSIVPAMKFRGTGHIVNVGSIFGSINYPHFVTYSSAKGGLRAFSEALRREVYGSGVDVTYIAPRAVKSATTTAEVLRFARTAKMNLDDPKNVACRIVRAIVNREKDVFIGFNERFFVRANALVPRLVDTVLRSQTVGVRKSFTP
jgi:short-subunit dehydrogenase